MTANPHVPGIDIRHIESRDDDMVFEMPLYDTLEEWETRASWLREHLLAVLGLWPLLERCPLDMQVTGSIEHDDYVVENVHFQSFPGFYCTGNLYRPRTAGEQCPGVLNPHGHWDRGRLEHIERGSIRARCIAFARMGMVAFAYDMVGYNDSMQVPRHRFATMRGALYGLSPMALQTWNSMRGVDMLQSLDHVDPERIGCTGASGGGTQTFMLAAVDDRVKVVAPVNMISAHFQGGCVCENAPGLRTDTCNMEIGALAAPRPMLMVSATGDWTVNTPRVEYPAIRDIYRLYGADEHLAWAQVDAEHNYNAESRGHVYRWFARWFLGDEKLAEGIERPFATDTDEQLRVFAGAGLPSGAPTGRALGEVIISQSEGDLAALIPTSPTGLGRLCEITSSRLAQVLEAEPVMPENVLSEEGAVIDGTGYRQQEVALGRRSAGDRVLGVLYQPLGSEPTRAALVVHGTGRDGVADAFGDPGDLILGLLALEYEVLVVEPFAVGSTPPETMPRRDGDWFWATFNRSLLSERVRDVLTALGYLAGKSARVDPVMVGLGAAGPWCLLAGALDSRAAAIIADTQATDYASGGAFLGELFAPALCRYGDLRLASALVSPRPLLLTNTAGRYPADWVVPAYELRGASQLLSVSTEPVDAQEMLGWLDGALQGGRG